MDINLIILVQRAIELLAFYLILANLYGKDLKTSLSRLIQTKQRTHYGNMVMMVVYPIGITLIIQAMIDHDLEAQGYLIDNVLRPLTAIYLLRLVFDLKKTLLSYIFLMMVSFIISLFALVFSLDGMFVFLWILFTTIFMAYRNYFEGIYIRLLRKPVLLNIMAALSIILYAVPFLTGSFPIITFPLFALLLFLVMIIHIKKETKAIVERITEAKTGELFDVLKELSAYYQQSEIIHTYTIKHYNVLDLAPPLSKKLEIGKRISRIKDYECILEKRQIKINVILFRSH